MTLARALAARAVALAALLGLPGCASLSAVLDAPLKPAAAADAAGAAGVAGAAPAPDAAASAAAAARRALQVDIQAPPDLKALLEQHLDLVRLGRLARDDVDDSEWQRLIDATPAQARELLQTEGYFNAGVQIEPMPAADGERNAGVRLQVQPGVQAKVKGVTLQVEGELERNAVAGDRQSQATLDRLIQGWELPVGAAFRNASWNSAKAAALVRLRAAGYAAATWSGTHADVDPQTNSVTLFLVAETGPLFRFGELQIEGLVVQDPETVSNLFAASRGDALTEARLQEFQDRLQRTYLFESTSVALDPDPAQAAHARVNVRLRESPLQTYKPGLGYSANTRARASLEQTATRVFGTSALWRNKAEYGELRKAWDGEISSHTGPDLYRNLVSGAVEQLKSDTDTVLSQRLRLGRSQDGQRIERLLYMEAERSVRKTLDDTVRTAAISQSLNYQGVWRALDSLVLPTEGYSLKGQLGVGYSHGTDAEPGPYSRVYLRATGYQPVGRTWYGQGRLELGQVILRSNQVVPESQQFRAGGDDSVRGYAYRSLGPLVDGAVGSGNALFTASIEMARPIWASLPTVWGAVFIDAGNAADKFALLHPAVGSGLGLRWRSPVGPVRLDLAYGDQTHKVRLHVSLGITL